MESPRTHESARASVLQDAETLNASATKAPARQLLADDLNETAIDLDLIKTLIDVAIDLIGDQTRKGHAENLLHVAMRYLPAAEGRVSELAQIAFAAEREARR